MGRKILIIIISVIIVIGIIGVIWFSLNPDESNAQLIIESGTVHVKHTGGSWISAQNGMLLYQSDYVKTGNNSSAFVVLFESSVIRLDHNTEVMIQEIIQQDGETSIKIKQDLGRTWNTIRNISGIDNYDVQTPTTIASIRGTSFDVNVKSFTKTDIGVDHGTIHISRIKDDEVIDTIEADKNESVTVDIDKINQPLEIKPFEKDEWVRNNQKKDEEIKKTGFSSYIDDSINVKEELYKRIEPYISELKDIYGLTDAELEALLDGYLLGYYDLPPETPKWIRELIELS